MAVEDNVLASNRAVDVFSVFVEPESVDNPRFWERMIELCQTKMPPKKEYETSNPMKPKPMNDIAAKAFESTLIPFGKNRGYRIKEVDLNYLEWLADEDDFIGQLRRYVLSKRFEQRKKQEL